MRFDRGSGASGRPTPVIIVGTNNAAAPLWISRDAGGAMRAVFGCEGHVYLCTNDGGLHLTTDGGKTFTRLPAVSHAGVVGFGKAAHDGGDPAVFLAGAVGQTTGIFRSDDRGQTWARINDDQHQYGWTNRAITGDPRIHGRVYFGTNGRGIIYGDPR